MLISHWEYSHLLTVVILWMGLYREARTIIIHRDANGFGFVLRGSKGWYYKNGLSIFLYRCTVDFTWTWYGFLRLFYKISQCERTTAPSVWNLLVTEEWVRPYGWPHTVSWGWTNKVAIWEQTCVVPRNVLLDGGSTSPHGKGQFYGDKIWMQRRMQLQRSVCESYASLC